MAERITIECDICGSVIGEKTEILKKEAGNITGPLMLSRIELITNKIGTGAYKHVCRKCAEKLEKCIKWLTDRVEFGPIDKDNKPNNEVNKISFKPDFSAAVLEKMTPTIPYDEWLVSVFETFSIVRKNISSDKDPFMVDIVYPKDRVIIAPVTWTNSHVLFYVGYKWVQANNESTNVGIAANNKWYIVERDSYDEYGDIKIVGSCSGTFKRKLGKILGNLGFLNKQLEFTKYWEKLDLKVYGKRKQ